MAADPRQESQAWCLAASGSVRLPAGRNIRQVGRMAFAVSPSRRLTNDLVVRTVLLWVGVRAALGLCVLVAAGAVLSGMRVLLGAGTFAGMIALVPVVLLLDVRVCRERLLFANLGVSPVRIFAVGLTIAAALETILLTLFTWLGT